MDALTSVLELMSCFYLQDLDGLLLPYSTVFASRAPLFLFWRCEPNRVSGLLYLTHNYVHGLP